MPQVLLRLVSLVHVMHRKCAVGVAVVVFPRVITPRNYHIVISIVLCGSLFACVGASASDGVLYRVLRDLMRRIRS